MAAVMVSGLVKLRLCKTPGLEVDMAMVFDVVERGFGIQGVLNCGFDGGFGSGFLW